MGEAALWSTAIWSARLWILKQIQRKYKEDYLLMGAMQGASVLGSSLAVKQIISAKRLDVVVEV